MTSRGGSVNELIVKHFGFRRIDKTVFNEVHFFGNILDKPWAFVMGLIYCLSSRILPNPQKTIEEVAGAIPEGYSTCEVHSNYVVVALKLVSFM